MLIDLHIHTTASDGLSDPAELLGQVRAAGITVFAVTDHDTVAALSTMSSLASDASLTFVAGVEITAVDRERDVHVLGYFIDATSPVLLEFLQESRLDRARRGQLMCEKLSAAGAPLEFETLQSGLPSPHAVISRPVVADALVNAGLVASRQEAFDRFLAEGRPAYVPRIGASPADVVSIIRRAGGLASLAHPGVTGKDDLIAPLVDAGLSAIECFHSAHSREVTSAYLALARRHGLAVTGGSDFHGRGTRRSEMFGQVGLPPEHYDTLVDRHRAIARAAGRA
jgi:predicted metal-dependent phosphoesterase TrpH